MRLCHKLVLGLFALCLIFSYLNIFAEDANDLRLTIYSKLGCNLTETLDKCDCAKTREIRAYVDAFLESGVSKEEIFYKVAKRYSLNTILDKQTKEDIEKRLIKETGKFRPQIILDTVSFDFGKVSRKQGKVSKVFMLTNKGNSLLIIKNIRTFCPCALVSLKINKEKSPSFDTRGSPTDWQAEVKPGKGAELEVTLDLTSPSANTGKLIREAAVLSNDPVYPEIKVKVEADVAD